MPGVLLQSAPNVSAKDFKFPRATYITLSRTHTLIHTLIQVNCYKNCRKKIIFIHFRNSPHVATVNQLNRIKNSVFSYGYVATATLSFSVHSIQNLVLTVQRPAEWLYQRRHASQKLFFFFMSPKCPPSREGQCFTKCSSATVTKKVLYILKVIPRLL